MEENESKQKNDSQSSIKEETIDFTYLFCPICLSYPNYSIGIQHDGEILLKHLCKNKDIKDISLNEIKSNKRFISIIKCKYCQKYCENICLKCSQFICSNCSEEHINYSSEYSRDNIKICPIQERQYFCKAHFMKVTHYCSICKIHLCGFDCLVEHWHYDCFPLYDYKDYQKFEINYDGKNKSLLQLSYIAKLFNDCYSYCLHNKNITFNIIQNHFLIKKIYEFIKKNKDKADKIKQADIIAKPESILKEPKLIKVYGGNEFQVKFFKLIFYVETGNIRSFHKLQEIKNFYEKNHKSIVIMNQTKRAYLI